MLNVRFNLISLFLWVSYSRKQGVCMVEIVCHDILRETTPASLLLPFT